MPATAVAIAVALAWAQRVWRARRWEARFRARHPAGPDGIVLGAESRTFPADGDRAILLVHGYNDAPTALEPVARVLQAAGWTVRTPLLPGHGRSLRAFERWTAEEALASLRAEYEALRATHGRVAVGGLSMGAALACSLAAEVPVAGLVLYSPMLVVPPLVRRALRLGWLWRPFTRYVAGGGARSILDPAARARQIAYRSSSWGSFRALAEVAALAESRLPRVQVPTLVFLSEGDNRLPPALALPSLAPLQPADRTVEWVRGAGHVITVDHGWAQVAERTAAWLDARVPVGAAGAASPAAPVPSPASPV